jgi:hypothetical protein
MWLTTVCFAFCCCTEWAKLSMLGWWVGITTALLVDGMALRENITKESKLRSNLTTLSKPSAEPNSQVAVNETKARTEKELTTLLIQRQTLGRRAILSLPH